MSDLFGARRNIKCFRRSDAEHPWHPLYLPYSSPMLELSTGAVSV